MSNLLNSVGRHLSKRRLRKSGLRSALVMSATSAGFCFNKHGITDEDMGNTVDLLEDPCRFAIKPPGAGGTTGPPKPSASPNPPRSKSPARSSSPPDAPGRVDPSKPSTSGSTTPASPANNQGQKVDGWEMLVDKPKFKLWRRTLNGDTETYLHEYKAFGTYTDLPPSAFFATQLDLAYRKQWDKNVIYLDVIDAEDASCQEVIRWVTYFPYPMSPREYIYVRRACVDDASNVLLLVSRATSHPSFPVQNETVRVKDYRSAMVIKPHKTFKDDGFDYVLTYFDDPQAPFPTTAYRWMASYGISEFLDKVYQAAKSLHANQPSSSRGIVAQLTELALGTGNRSASSNTSLTQTLSSASAGSIE